ncbi:MAG: site-specific DNA-methyltransferase [Candidatus Heimdallarchaeota archaeon]|nr:site-specific DNA-methyltransferase [Candidatus Heimdallarchaeota archaeon]
MDISSIINSIHLDESIEFMKRLHHNCIDVILTSPPFYADDIYTLDNGEPEFGWTDYQEYLNHLLDFVELALDLVKPGGKMILIMSNTPVLNQDDLIIGSYPIVYDVFKLAETAGWKYYTEIIWHKTSPSYDEGDRLPTSPNAYPVAHHDTILVFQKGKSKRNGAPSKYPSVWTLPASGDVKAYDYVYNSFPERMVKQLLEMFSLKNDIVLDPYAGSGQVIRTAISMKRKAIGVEIDARWQRLWTDVNKET